VSYLGEFVISLLSPAREVCPLAREDCLAELAGALGPPRPRGVRRDDSDRAGMRDRIWWGLLKLQMGANGVELACLSI